MFHPDILNQILHEVSTKDKVDTIMKFSKNIYDLHQFNIFSLYPKQVKKLKDSLDRRYLNNEIKVLGTSWNQGQRRLFVWLLVCFLYVRNVKPERITDQDWEGLSQLFHFKKPIFLDFQLKNIFKVTKNKSRWTEEQERILKLSIQSLSRLQVEPKKFNNWNDVSKDMFFKTNRIIFKSPKACRQRWYNHLDKSKRKDDFTIQEDYKLITHLLKGQKSWSKLVKIFDESRTQHRIKNRYFSLIKKFNKQTNHYCSQNSQNLLRRLTQVQILQQIKEKLQKSLNIQQQPDGYLNDGYLNDPNEECLQKKVYSSQPNRVVKIEQNQQEQNQQYGMSSEEIQGDPFNHIIKEENSVQEEEFQNSIQGMNVQNNEYLGQNKGYLIFPTTYFRPQNIYTPLQYQNFPLNIGAIPTFLLSQYLYYTR